MGPLVMHLCVVVVANGGSPLREQIGVEVNSVVETGTTPAPTLSIAKPVHGTELNKTTRRLKKALTVVGRNVVEVGEMPVCGVEVAESHDQD